MSETQQRTVVKRVPNGRLYSDGTILIENVRASYPHILEPYRGKNDKGQDTARYGVVGILPKDTHKEVAQLCSEEVRKLLKKHNTEDLAKRLWFVRNGDDEGKAEYKGAYIVSAGETKKPDARDRDKRKLVFPDDKDVIYGGCYVDILIRPWWQPDKGNGKRANAGLTAIRFLRDGESFGTNRISEKDVDDTFDDVDDEPAGGTAAGDDDDL
jgi:hypothetical protein